MMRPVPRFNTRKAKRVAGVAAALLILGVVVWGMSGGEDPPKKADPIAGEPNPKPAPQPEPEPGPARKTELFEVTAAKASR